MQHVMIRVSRNGRGTVTFGVSAEAAASPLSFASSPGLPWAPLARQQHAQVLAPSLDLAAAVAIQAGACCQQFR